MFGLGSIQTYIIGALVAVAIGFGAGWKTRDAFCDAAEAKAQVAQLQRQINARDAAERANNELADKQAAEISDLERQADDLRGKISAGECFSVDDVSRLRGLWPK